jgi:asparagine synthase (glutamine-hydrolysing)
MTQLGASCRVASHRGQPSGCAWDGRLDDPQTADPAELALDLYRSRGAEGFRELIGDWSLALWDADAETLVLASDYAGARPLYFRIDGPEVVWGSDLAAVADDTPELDDRYFAVLLAPGQPAGLTPFRGVEPVPAGCAVLIRKGAVRVERFWQLPHGPELRLGAGRDYEERLVELFREAVGSRVRCHAHVCCELSGGLDSSSIACMALRLHPKVTTFSYTYPGATDDPYIRAVEQQYGLEGVHLDVRDFPFVTAEATGGATPGWWEPRFRGLAQEMEARGATALLTGQLGDLAMGNVLDDSEQAAGPLRRLRLGAAGREAYAWSQALRVPIYPILWRAARMAFSSWAPEDAADLSPTTWRAKSQANSVGERLRRTVEGAREVPALNWGAAPPDRRRRFRGLAGWLDRRRLQAPGALQSFDYSHPFADRRLIEFLLAIPTGVIVRPGEPRRLMRRAFRELLPEPVLLRRSKASFGGFYEQCLMPLAQDMLRAPDRLRTVELGYLERQSLIERLGRFVAGAECNAAQLHIAILVEFWLRNARYR